jgi:hypothetical protein
MVFVTTIFVPGAASAQEMAAAPAACIAIVLPSVQGVEGNAADVGAALRDVFVSYLSGPSIRVVPLDSRLTIQAVQEARQKECPNLLIATLTRKRSGNGGGMFGKVLGQAGTSMVWGIPGGGVGGAIAQGVASAGAQAMSELATTTRAKDEMRLTYRLMSAEQQPFLQKEERLKASIEGEDLVTPMVQKAAESIATAVIPVK